MTNESKSPKFSAEVRERAVRMVFEHRSEHTSQWAAIAVCGSKGAVGRHAVRRQKPSELYPASYDAYLLKELTGGIVWTRQRLC